MEMFVFGTYNYYGSLAIKYPGQVDWKLFPVNLLYWKRPGKK
jgi:hypothetical protein